MADEQPERVVQEVAREIVNDLHAEIKGDGTWYNGDNCREFVAEHLRELQRRTLEHAAKQVENFEYGGSPAQIAQWLRRLAEGKDNG